MASSVNGGITWVRADAGLPDVPVTKLAVDPGDATGNTVYAATWLGVYRTTNGGTSWSIFGSGLPQGRVTDIWVSPDSSVVRASTWGRGIWELASTGGKSLDLNGDGVVDLRDLLTLTKYFGLANATCDLYSDGTVDDVDLTLLLLGL